MTWWRCRCSGSATRRRCVPVVPRRPRLPAARTPPPSSRRPPSPAARQAGVLEPFGAKLELVSSVLGCAAQLLRIDAIVPVRARSEPGLATAARGGKRPPGTCSESDESGAGSASDDDDFLD